MRASFAILLVVAGLAAGCSHHSSILDAGVRSGALGHVHRIGPAEARAAARRASREWEQELRKRGPEDPGTRFPNLSRQELLRRLDEAARAYEFDVVSVTFLRPRQLAPRIVVRTKHYQRLARATPAILKRIDPRAPAQGDYRGWRYEGFFFEAQDEHGIPFLATFNFWRGSGPGGGEWARSEPLYPFPHG